MKSIMEEASSISKAIENGWKRAGMPAQFSIKILEHPEFNFFGMNTKAAKIAVLFEETVAHQHKNQPREQHHPKKEPVDHHKKQDSHPKEHLAKTRHQEKIHAKKEDFSHPRNEKKQSINKEQAPQEKRDSAQLRQPRTQENKPHQTNTHKPQSIEPDIWTLEMVDVVNAWIKETLKHIGLPNIPFTAKIEGTNLKIKFDTQVLENIRSEQVLFNSFSLLIMETLRGKYNKKLNRIGIVFVGA